MASTSIQVGEGGSKHEWPARRLAALFVAVMILAAGMGVGVRWLQQYMHYKAAAKPDAVTLKAQHTQDLAANGKYDEAQRQIAEALKNPQLTSADKYTLLFQQGVNYENHKSYAAAIDSYKEADSLQSTQGVAEALARVATASGDKKMAIVYYQKAIDRIPSTKPTGGDDKAHYQQAIKDLESTE